MKFLEEIKQLLKKKFQRQKSDWLVSSFEKNIEVSLGVPSEQEALQSSVRVQQWIKSWQQYNAVGELIWCERQWTRLGTQRLPQKLIFKSPEEVTQMIGEYSRWQMAKQRFEILIKQWPVLKNCVSRCYDTLANYSQLDFERLVALLHWILENPNSQLYPRQLPIRGLDSKWIETRKELIYSLILAMKDQIGYSKDTLNNNFFECCGLKQPPKLIRLRILDSNLREKVGHLSDLTLPVEEVAFQLKLPISTVFIVENLQTGLSFADMPGAIVFMRLGYHVEVFKQIHWLQHLPCFYWGDIDSHGFAILNRLRNYLPHVSSILMDQKTLMEHQLLWGYEEKQHAAKTLPLLTEDEHALYQMIKQQKWQKNIRLEQERIEWNYALPAINSTLNRSK